MANPVNAAMGRPLKLEPYPEKFQQSTGCSEPLSSTGGLQSSMPGEGLLPRRQQAVPLLFKMAVKSVHLTGIQKQPK